MALPMVVRLDRDHPWYRNIKLAEKLYDDGTPYDDVTRIIERMHPLPEDAPADIRPHEIPLDPQAEPLEEGEAWDGWTWRDLIEMAAVLLEDDRKPPEQAIYS